MVSVRAAADRLAVYFLVLVSLGEIRWVEENTRFTFTRQCLPPPSGSSRRTQGSHTVVRLLRSAV